MGQGAGVEFVPLGRYQTCHVHHPTAAALAGSERDAAMPTRHARALRLWLGAVALLIVAMILVGGATRLTDSGLSITEWQPIMGAIPPLSEADWQKAFAAYQKIPEYTELKRGMSLDAFKTIFWWEWAHRFLGRLIGVAFFVPFVVFWIAGYIPRALLPRLIGLFLLGGLQGAVGWYMVKSGLVERTDVSQYRLAAHFGVALVILGYTLWLLFGIGARAHAAALGARAARPGSPRLVLVLIFVQMLAGALVAGLDAGMGYNTWPLINGALRAVRPRRSLALVSQPVREPAHRAVRSPHAGLYGGAGRALPSHLARGQGSAADR